MIPLIPIPEGTHNIINNAPPASVNWPTIALSLVALTVSLVSLYNQYFKKSYKLLYIPTLIDYKWYAPLLYDFVLGNAGNTPIVVVSISYFFPNERDNGIVHYPSTHTDPTKTFPFLIKPGEMVPLQITTYVDLLTTKPSMSIAENDKKISFQVSFAITCILANGKKIDSIIPQGTLTFLKDGSTTLYRTRPNKLEIEKDVFSKEYIVV